MGFTTCGWHKRGNIADHNILNLQGKNNILHHRNNTNDVKSRPCSSSLASDNSNQVDNRKIIFHPCVNRAINPDCFDPDSVVCDRLN